MLILPKIKLTKITSLGKNFLKGSIMHLLKLLKHILQKCNNNAHSENLQSSNLKHC